MTVPNPINGSGFLFKNSLVTSGKIIVTFVILKRKENLHFCRYKLII